MKVVFGFVLLLAGCSQKADASQQQPVTVVCSCAPPAAPPPPPPCTSDPATPAPTAEAPPATKPAATGSPLELARQAALRNEPATVRRHLEEKVRNGKGTPEEVNLVKQACKSMADKACQDDLKKKYPAPNPANGDPMGGGILF